MIRLSFSTINNCLQPENSHNWINRMCGLKPEDRYYYHEGTKAHRIIQDHVSGKVIMSELSDIDISFDIVEEKDRDERTFFEFNLREKMAEFKQESSFKNDYVVVGYYDGLNADKTRFLEIKTSSNPWSIGKFKRSFQRKIYALSNTNLKEAYLITCGRKISDWILKKPKIYKLKITEQDYIDALSFINNAVALLEKGDFRGGLNENGVCDSYGCYYGKNCQFK